MSLPDTLAFLPRTCSAHLLSVRVAAAIQAIAHKAAVLMVARTAGSLQYKAKRMLP